MKDVFSWSPRTCSSCMHWEGDPIFDGNNGVVNLCNLGQHGHDRTESPEWMRGSDRCSKWEKKVIIKLSEETVKWMRGRN